MDTRFQIIDLDSVIAELEGSDVDGGHIIPNLPEEKDVEKVLSDRDTVRYFIYTEPQIHEVFIDTIAGLNNIDGIVQDWVEEDWELITIPR